VNKTDIWMPLYIGDYLSATTRLTTEQHGAYLLLMLDYWKNGPLPDNDAILAQITRLNPDAWANARGILQAFFRHEGGQWVHGRIEKELQAAKDRQDKASEKGKLGANARWHGSGNATGIPQAMPNTMPTDSSSPSPSSSQSKAQSSSPKTNRARFTPPSVQDVQAYCIERQNNVNAEHFVDHYTANGWKVGKNPMKDWKAAIRTWEKRNETHHHIDTRSRAKRVSDKLDAIAKASIEREIAAGTLDSGDFQKIAG